MENVHLSVIRCLGSTYMRVSYYQLKKAFVATNNVSQRATSFSIKEIVFVILLCSI
jgi:hypothetical protein